MNAAGYELAHAALSAMNNQERPEVYGDIIKYVRRDDPERVKAILHVIRTGTVYQPLADKWRNQEIGHGTNHRNIESARA